MTAENEILKKIVDSPVAKHLEDVLQKALEHQWTDMLLSGMVNSIYLRYKDYFVNRQGMKIKLRKDWQNIK